MLMTDNVKLMRLACVLFAAKIVMLGYLSLNTRFVMDEFWQFGQTKYLWNGFYDTIWPVKSVGYALWYAPAHGVGWDATSTLLAGRAWALVTVLATLGVVAGISRNLGHSWLKAITVLLLLLSVSTYMERSFRLRSETPAILFAALSLWVVMRSANLSAALPSMRSVAAAGALTGLAFLCTQKAVYFNLALGVALTAVFLHGSGVVGTLRAIFFLMVGWVASILAYCVVFGGADAFAVLYQLFVGPANLVATGGELYNFPQRYIFQTLLRNLPFYAIFAVGLIIALGRFRTQPPATIMAAIFTGVITGLVFSHNQPWPYVFAMCLPFLALWSPYVWDVIIAASPKRTKLGPVIVALLVVMTFSRNVDYIDHSNVEQLDVIRTAEALIGPGETYFDGIGMLPNAADAPRWWLDTPRIAQINKDPDDLLQALTETPPKLIIETYRTDRLPEDFAAWTAAHYVPVAPGFLVPGVRVSPGDTVKWAVVKPARYRVIHDGDAPDILIDGAPATWPMELSRGGYDVSVLAADVPILIVPETTALLPERPERQPLFADIYSQ